MALTTSVLTRVSIGTKRMIVARVTFDSSYPTGGETLNLSDIGMRDVECILTDGAEGYHLKWDKTNSKLLVYSSAATQVTNATDLSALDAVVAFIGL